MTLLNFFNNSMTYIIQLALLVPTHYGLFYIYTLHDNPLMFFNNCRRSTKYESSNIKLDWSPAQIL